MNLNNTPFGNFFDDFEVGQRIDHKIEKTISEGEHQLFTLLTMNHHLSHISDNAAAKTEFKRKLVNGTYVFSLVVGITVPELSFNATANLGYNRVDHLGPTFEGETVSATSIVMNKRLSKSRLESGIIEFETTGFANGKEVLRLTRNILIPKK